MRYIVLFIIGFLQIGAFAQSDQCDRYVSGKILSRETNEALPFATITILKTDLSAIASESGEFRIDNICEDEIH